MLNEKNSRKNKLRQRKKRIGLICVLCFLIIGTITVTIKFIPRKDDQNLITKPTEDNNQSIDSDEIANNTEKVEDNVDKNENITLDNSGYLTLENDPNADDAEMVAENTKGLLNGTKSYPVRTDGKKVVYLTFDDGPSTTNTPTVLDVLNRYNVKGTFFVLGTSIEANDQAKTILKDIAKEGHAIANHTYGHDYKYLYPNRVMNVDNIISDVEKNNNIMREVLGQDFSTRVIRFPGGYWSWEGRTAMKEKMEEVGYYNVDWNALNKDAEGKVKNADELVQCVKDGIQTLGPNADSVVLLMHDTYGKEETAKALPQIIEYLQSQGFEFKTIK